VPRQQVDTLFFSKNLGPTYNKIFNIAICLGNVIGHSAGAVGYIICLFQNRDIHIRRVPLGLAGGAHAGCIATDNDEFHLNSSFLFS